MQNYLVPANSKKSLLILGLFTQLDLIIFLSGSGLTVFLLLIFDLTSLLIIIFVLLPLVTSAVLVLPLPYYHNILQLITNVVVFYSKSQRYYWKGWCIRDGEESTK